MAGKLPALSDILLDLRGSGLLVATFDTVKTLNSFDENKYKELIAVLKFASQDDRVKAVVLLANGRYFSSGAALSQERIASLKAGKAPARSSAIGAQSLVDVLIDFPKLLIAGLQGPAYGIAVTMLSFFDLVYATPIVTMTTPFSSLGICLEGCSSVLFPQLLGKSLTSRLLYLAQTIKVEEFLGSGFIADVFAQDGFQNKVIQTTEKSLEGLYLGSIMSSKRLVMDPDQRARLHRVNAAEMAQVALRQRSQDHIDAINGFEAKRKARKAAALKL